MSKKIILTLTVASTIALVVAVGTGNLSKTETAPASALVGTPGPEAPYVPRTAAPHPSDNLPGAALLEGVDIISGITLHPDGSLQYTLQLRHLFDHFLGMAGTPERVPAARDALNQHLQAAATNQPSQTEALQAFDRYVEYLQEAEQVELSSYEAGDLERTFDVLFSLRRSLLGTPLAEAFFGDEEAREQIIVAQRRIAADRELSPSERERLYAELEDTLPPHLQEMRHQATAVTRLNQDTAALRSAGATDAAIQQMREQQVGHEAAYRLSELDQARAEWADRVETYQQERDAVLAAGPLSPEEHEAALGELRERYFNEHEMRRIAALERSHNDY